MGWLAASLAEGEGLERPSAVARAAGVAAQRGLARRRRQPGRRRRRRDAGPAVEPPLRTLLESDEVDAVVVPLRADHPGRPAPAARGRRRRLGRQRQARRRGGLRLPWRGPDTRRHRLPHPVGGGPRAGPRHAVRRVAARHAPTTHPRPTPPARPPPGRGRPNGSRGRGGRPEWLPARAAAALLAPYGIDQVGLPAHGGDGGRRGGRVARLAGRGQGLRPRRAAQERPRPGAGGARLGGRGGRGDDGLRRRARGGRRPTSTSGCSPSSAASSWRSAWCATTPTVRWSGWPPAAWPATCCRTRCTCSHPSRPRTPPGHCEGCGCGRCWTASAGWSGSTSPPSRPWSWPRAASPSTYPRSHTSTSTPSSPAPTASTASTSSCCSPPPRPPTPASPALAADCAPAGRGSRTSVHETTAGPGTLTCPRGFVTRH